MNTLRAALNQERPLQIVGTINAYTALLAQQAGLRAIYLSGSGVASASYGLPDLGITNLDNVLIDVRRITDVCALPLLVDIDTGWGSHLNIARAVTTIEKAGAAAVHIEDQVANKRCGHRPNKEIVSTEEMCDRLKAAIDAKITADFVIMARTDALAQAGLSATIERCVKYTEAGADMIFFEGVTDLNQYAELTQQCKIPVLANITEFGVTPIFSKSALAATGVQLILYPLSAFRAMSNSALQVYRAIQGQGSQQSMLPHMQTREQLYDTLNYYGYEEKFDQLFAKEKVE